MTKVIKNCFMFVQERKLKNTETAVVIRNKGM